MGWIRFDRKGSDAARGRPFIVQMPKSGFPMLALTRPELVALVAEAQATLKAHR